MADEKVKIEFDGYNLQDDTIITENIVGDDNLPRKEIDTYELPLIDGGKVTAERLKSRIISINGIIKSATASGLIGKLEEFKEKLTHSEKTLKITYPNSYIRIYTASVNESLEINRAPWAINIAPFKVSFICVEPWSIQTQTSISGVYDINGSITNLSVGISGMADPQPKIFFNTTTSGQKFIINNKTTNTSMEVSTTFSGIGRSLLIDTYNFDVSLDQNSINYKGIFPEFNIGINDLSIITVSEFGGGTQSALDQYSQDINLISFSVPIGGNYIRGQSFIPSLNKLLYVEFYLLTVSNYDLNDITVELYTDSGGYPDSLVASATIVKFNISNYVWKRAIFNSPVDVTTGNTYWLLLKSPTAYSFSYGLATYSVESKYSDGEAIWSNDGGNNWYKPINNYDRLFRTFGEQIIAGQTGGITGKLVIQYNPRRW